MFHAAVNIAAFIGDDNLIDSHASIASAAQIGNKNKIGSFVSLEGVLSPANAQPVLIGDENFIGSFARIGTGITLGNRNFIGAGVNISKGTKLKDCRDGSPSKGSYLNVQELNGAFNNLAIAPNNAVRVFNEISLVPGEYILFENSEEFMARFEGDDRIKAKN
jgi:tetrahydrodipicolinate N-succinyltransferase